MGCYASDFNSTDGIKSWLLDNFKEELDAGYLKYFFTAELNGWRMLITKNTAHLLALNDILVSLDCDNYTGYNGGRFELFLKFTL